MYKISYESNTLIFSKDIKLKPFFIHDELEKGPFLIIIGEFCSKSNDLYSIPAYNIKIQYTNLFKRYQTETIFPTDRQDIQTDCGKTTCSCTIENGESIKKNLIHATF